MPETDLPALFAERRLAVLARSNLKIEALKLYLKASSRSLAGQAGGRNRCAARRARPRSNRD